MKFSGLTNTRMLRAKFLYCTFMFVTSLSNGINFNLIRFCQTQGYKYVVEELPPQFPPVFKQYADKIQPPAVLSKMRAVGVVRDGDG